jgi:hypothetical protein
MQALQGAGRTVGAGASSEGGMPTLGRSVKAPPAQKVDTALEALRQAFAKRGCDSLLRLGKKFSTMDDDQSHQLTYEEVRSPSLHGVLLHLHDDIEGDMHHQCSKSDTKRYDRGPVTLWDANHSNRCKFTQRRNMYSNTWLNRHRLIRFSGLNGRKCRAHFMISLMKSAG